MFCFYDDLLTAGLSLIVNGGICWIYRISQSIPHSMVFHFCQNPPVTTGCSRCDHSVNSTLWLQREQTENTLWPFHTVNCHSVITAWTHCDHFTLFNHDVITLWTHWFCHSVWPHREHTVTLWTATPWSQCEHTVIISHCWTTTWSHYEHTDSVTVFGHTENTLWPCELPLCGHSVNTLWSFHTVEPLRGHTINTLILSQCLATQRTHCDPVNCHSVITAWTHCDHFTLLNHYVITLWTYWFCHSVWPHREHTVTLWTATLWSQCEHTVIISHCSTTLWSHYEHSVTISQC